MQEEAELPNLLPERLAEQKVEFSIELVDPGYRELLDDPDSPQYIDLATHLQEQVTTPPPLAPPLHLPSQSSQRRAQSILWKSACPL